MSKVTIIIISIFLFGLSVSIGYAGDDLTAGISTKYQVNTYAFEPGILPGSGGSMAIGTVGTMGIFSGMEIYVTGSHLELPPSTLVDSIQVRGEKDPFLAGLLSWFMLGIGQIYVGDYTKGSLFIAAGFVDKVALVALISHINTKYAPSSDEIVNLNWKSFDASTKVMIVSYLVSSFGLRFYSVVDAVHSANAYNRRLYGQAKDQGMSFDVNVDAYSLTYNFQFND